MVNYKLLVLNQSIAKYDLLAKQCAQCFVDCCIPVYMYVMLGASLEHGSEAQQYNDTLFLAELWIKLLGRCCNMFVGLALVELISGERPWSSFAHPRELKHTLQSKVG